MNNKIALLIAGVAVVALAVATFFIMKPEETPVVIEDVPAYGTDNPLEKKPELNPVTKTNPYANIKTNPFE